MILDMNRGRPAKKPRSPFGQRLVAAREQAGLTQTALGEIMGVSQRAVAHWERTPTALYPEQIEALATALNTSTDELLGFKTQKKKPGPPSKLERQIDELLQLPKPKQRFVSEFLDTVLQTAK